MIKSLNWRLTGPSVYSIVNWLIAQWDSFLHFHFGHISYNNQNYYLQNTDPGNQGLYEEHYVSFKLANHVSYRRFRETIQVLDASMLDISILKYSPRHVAAALLFLAISEYFRQTHYALLTFTSLYAEMQDLQVQEMQGIVEEMMVSFVTAAIGIDSLDEICPAARALFPFLNVELNDDLLPVCKIQPK